MALVEVASHCPTSEIDLVNTSTAAELFRNIEDRLKAGMGFAVATLNLDHVVKLRTDAQFRRAYLRHNHVVADGNPVVWLRRLAGRPVDLVTGSDMVDPLMEMAARLGTPVAFLGATAESLEAAADRLKARFPKLNIVARISPSFDFDPTGAEADEALKRVKNSGAKLCLLALGAPKQELLAAGALDAVPGCGFVSIGAGLDFIAGSQRRAPLWMRRVALEWLWRLANAPRRLARRYADCFGVLPGMAIQAVSMRRRGSTP